MNLSSRIAFSAIETLVNIYHTAWRHIPGITNLSLPSLPGSFRNKVSMNQKFSDTFVTI
jgi:hypothetical protein